MLMLAGEIFYFTLLIKMYVKDLSTQICRIKKIIQSHFFYKIAHKMWLYSFLYAYIYAAMQIRIFCNQRLGPKDFFGSDSDSLKYQINVPVLVPIFFTSKENRNHIQKLWSFNSFFRSFYSLYSIYIFKFIL